MSSVKQCPLAFLGIAAIGLINEALDEGDLQKTMAALQNPAAKLTDIDPSLAQHYYDILQEARREKAHVRTLIQTHNNNSIFNLFFYRSACWFTPIAFILSYLVPSFLLCPNPNGSLSHFLNTQ